MDLNKLRDEAYATAREHGWHDEEHGDEMYLMLIITEIAEAVQADRKGWRANTDKYIELISDREEHDSDLWFKCAFSQNIKGTVEEELADVVIRCLDLAGLRGIDLSPAQEIIKNLESLKERSFTDLCYALSRMATCNDTTNEKVLAIIACVLRYCKLSGIDLEWFITQKMKYNRMRPYKHGGLKY